MNCIKRLPRSAGEYRAGTEYLPQDRVSCDGSIFVSLRRQSGNRPSVTVNGDGTYDTADGWMIIAVGASVPGGGKPMVGNPSINGVELVGDRTSAELGLASAGDIPERVSQLDNDAGYLTGGRLRTVNGESLVGEGDIKIEGGGGASVTVDAELSDSSENPVQNKVVTSKVNELETSINNITDKVYKESFVIETGVYTKVDDVSGNYTIVTDKDTINKCIDSSNKNPGHVGVSVVVDAETVLNLAVSTGDDSRLLGVASVAQSASTVIYQLLLKKDGNSVLNKQEIENVDISNYYTKNEADTKLSGYVLKIDGKSLSTNDYTDEDKTKVGKALTEHQSLGNYYTKEEVDSKVAQGGTFDPTAYYNKHDVDSLVGGKVDKVEGKQLSSNDYTDDDKAKVQSAVQTYDASWVEEYHTNNSTVTEDLLNQLADAVTSGKKVLIVKDADTYQCVANIDSSSSSSLGKVINLLTTKYSIGVYFYRLAANRTVYRTTFNLSIDDAINGSSYNTVTNKAIYAALQDKQDIISDIETIRSGAAKGETALQSFTESDPLYTKDKPSLALKSEIPDVSGLANKTDIPDVSGLVKSSDLAEVATSGDYNDLANKPSIPSEVTEQTVSGWGFTKNSGTYSKPSGGIPKSDLSSAVQTSLGKADTALQGVPSTYRTAAVQDAIDSGKVDKVTGKGLSTNDYTDAEKTKVANALTSHQTLKTINGNSLVGTGDIAIGGGGGSYDASAIVAKASGADWGDITKAEFDAVAEAIVEKKAIWSKQTLETDRAAYTDYIQWLSYLAAEDEVYKQIVLYSCDGSCNDYINLSLTDSSTYQIKRFYYDFPSKTSELTNDSGFITSSEVDTKIAAIPSVDRRVLNVRELYIGFGNTYFNGVNAITLSSTEFVIIGRSAGLNISLPDGSDADGKEYVCQFYVGDNGSEFTLTLPNSVIWLNGEAPTIESNACYTLSIVNHYAVIGVFKESS